MLSKRKWHTIGIPETLFNRIKSLIRKTGHISVSEYARFAINERIKFDTEQLESEKDEY